MKNVLAVVKFLFSIGLASFDYFYLVLCIYLFIVKKKKKCWRETETQICSAISDHLISTSKTYLPIS